MSERIQYVESAGLQIAYQEIGDPDRPLVIVHHGFLDCGGAWQEVMKPLATHFRVVMMDARGHGESEWVGSGGAYWFPDYILDLTALMDALQVTEERPCALVGHSMGGAVCSYTAGTYPKRVHSLTLIEGLGPPKHPWAHAPAHMRQFVETTRRRQADRAPEVMPDLEAAAARLRQYDTLLTETRAATHAAIATRPVKRGYVWKWDPLHRARMGAMYVEEIAVALLANISARVQLIDGGKSPFKHFDVSKRRSAIREPVEVTMPDAGHNIHRHQPERLGALIQAFLLKYP